MSSVETARSVSIWGASRRRSPYRLNSTLPTASRGRAVMSAVNFRSSAATQAVSDKVNKLNCQLSSGPSRNPSFPSRRSPPVRHLSSRSACFRTATEWRAMPVPSHRRSGLRLWLKRLRSPSVLARNGITPNFRLAFRRSPEVRSHPNGSRSRDPHRSAERLSRFAFLYCQ